MSRTMSVDIEYCINGKKFDIYDLEGVSYDDVGVPYSNALFVGGGNDIIFIIKNNGFATRNIRK